jgi:hypothetical protein
MSMDKILTMDPVIISPGKGPGPRYSNASWVALIGCAEDAKVAGALTSRGSSATNRQLGIHPAQTEP